MLPLEQLSPPTMGSAPAFTTGLPLPLCDSCRGPRTLCAQRLIRAPPSIPRPTRSVVLCNSTNPGPGRRARRWGAGLLAALALAAGGLGGVRATATESRATANGTAKELRYDGRTELDGTEKMLSLAITGGAFAALSIWAWRRNREDDELEQIRIREEVERLEKLKAEFMDVEEDDDSMDDEDLLKELSKRLEKDAEDAEDGEGDGKGEDGDAETGAKASATGVADNGTGVKPEAGGEAGSESLDMLRRMWEATDDEKKDGGGTSAPAGGQ